MSRGTPTYIPQMLIVLRCTSWANFFPIFFRLLLCSLISEAGPQTASLEGLCHGGPFPHPPLPGVSGLDPPPPPARKPFPHLPWWH